MTLASGAVGAEAVVVADDAAGDPGAVTVGVGLRAVVQGPDATVEDRREPIARDRGGGEQDVVAQFGVRGVDARIDDRDLDASALGRRPRLADAVTVVLPLQHARAFSPANGGAHAADRAGRRSCCDAVDPRGLETLLRLDLRREAAALARDDGERVELGEIGIERGSPLPRLA